MSVRRTSESESLLWPTPSAVEYGNNQSLGPNAAVRPSLSTIARRFPTPQSYSFDQSHRPGLTKLDVQVRGLYPESRRYWPTPQAHDAMGGRGMNNLFADGHYYPHDLADAVIWPTPTVRDKGTIKNVTRGAHASPGGTPLAVAVTQFPTPASRDYRSPNTKPYSERGGGKKGEQLPNAIGGQLNPTWVEWLMGFPLGWTDLKDSATPSSRRSRNGSEGGSSPSTKENADGNNL